MSDRNTERPAITRSAPLIAAAVIALLALVIGAATVAWAVNRTPADQEQGAGSPAAGQPTTTPPAEEDGAEKDAAAVCPEATTRVVEGGDLQKALDEAQPGDVIVLDEGRYLGEFVAKSDGEPDAPITLCGTSQSVLDGGDVKGGYVFHLDGAENWVLQGFSVENGQKGVMADGTNGSVIRDLTVSHIGDEAIHLRGHSSDNRVIDNVISDTGLRKPKFGEGIYIGTAESNWCDITDCEPDNSDRNLVAGNTIFATTSESVDIKEGTSDGILRDNTFDGGSISAADSWVDVKGNGWIIEGNTGTRSPADGFQTHEILDGWGTDNVFRGNTAELDGSGLGFSLKPERENVVICDNTVGGQGAELTNVECRD
jgi:Right handed beta helix region